MQLFFLSNIFPVITCPIDFKFGKRTRCMLPLMEHLRSRSRRKADEVQILEDTIRTRNEQHKKAGVELDATCHICLKTKFADGIGHRCNYCSIRCCARCGGKVTLRSNKVGDNVSACALFDLAQTVVSAQNHRPHRKYCTTNKSEKTLINLNS